MSRDPNRRIYEFSGFRLDPAQRRLLHYGKPIPLKPKLFDLLLFVVKMEGQLVEKDDLMREVWPDTIVEENNITVSISMLRKILGEDRLERQFIETVPRRGYRFVADVTQIPVGSSPAKVSERKPADGELPIDALAVLPMQNVRQDPFEAFRGSLQTGLSLGKDHWSTLVLDASLQIVTSKIRETLSA